MKNSSIIMKEENGNENGNENSDVVYTKVITPHEKDEKCDDKVYDHKKENDVKIPIAKDLKEKNKQQQEQQEYGKKNESITTEEEKKKLEQQEKMRKASLISIRKLYSYADRYDICLMIIGTIAAIGTGIIQPLQTIFFSDILNAFNAPGPKMQSAINKIILKFIYIGAGMFCSGFLQSTCWTITASRQSKRIKQQYVHSIIKQEIGWYDQNDPLQLATKVADLMTTVQEGIGRKMAEGAQFFAMFVAGFIIGFIKGWELTLVILACSPFLALSMFAMMKALAIAVQDGSAAYAKAGGIAEETLGSIRTIHSFNAIPERVKKFDAALEDTEKAGIKKGLATGLGVGILFLVAFLTYGVALCFGAYKVVNDRENCHGTHCYDGGKVLMIFFSVVTGAMAFGQAGPSMEAVFSAKAAAYDVFELMSRTSEIDPFSKEGKTKNKLEGNIQVRDVTFRYPSRKEVTVCKNYNLEIKAGEKVALVGPSGSGKSTVISLIERFYDPEIGCILVDGIDIREYNVGWLRQQISLVGQEPVLFSMSILENIKYGKIGQVTDEEALDAAKKANAYDFIMSFPKAFDTLVGERGIQLSGGQKQRIAIARAIIKDPSILLLDEATSALDTESERIVQDSLDTLLLSKKRTTIIVAHRLSTIQDANRIAVHDSGNIVEIGTHGELMKIENGKYRKLVETQNHGLSGSSNNLSVDASSSHSIIRSSNSANAEKENNIAVNIEESPQEMEEVKLGNDDKPSTKTQKRGLSCIKKKDNEKQTELEVPLSRIWEFSKPDKPYIVFGCIGAILAGCVFPIWGFLLTKMTVLFYETGSRGHVLYMARLWAMGFALLGFTYFIGALLQNVCFFLISERITRRIRSLCFNRMLQQEIGWFDMDDNLSGALTTRLATDSATIQSITSESLNRTVTTIFSLATALIIAFIYSWQMTLAIFLIFPFMGFSSYMQAQVMSGKTSKKNANDSDAKAGSLLSEAVGAIRTVSSFSLEEHLVKQYNCLVSESDATDRYKAIIGGLAFGFAGGLIFMAVSFLYWFGGELVSHGHITFEDMFMVIMCVMFSSFSFGIAAQNLGEAARAKEAANGIFRIIDRKPLIDAMESQGLKPESVKGHILFKNLDFVYPSRPKIPIYTGYSLEVPQGQTVALVGPSGSGKSTAISLLERFYNPVGGSILLDGIDIQSYNIGWLRQNVSLVSQEPSLFVGTIEENVKFGKFDATHEEVIRACQNANAHDFIMQFPDQYQTNVGEHGVQISGGQKQRIAIARAILRDPAILLLDEATSALDNESEEIVQKSLDQLLLMKKRTTIVVAHRLSTIQNADKIAVTQNGQIVEEGKHDDLMRRPNGVYKTLVSKQMAAFEK